jgi:hypothetical protein
LEPFVGSKDENKFLYFRYFLLRLKHSGKKTLIAFRKFIEFRKKFEDVSVKSLVNENCERGIYLKTEINIQSSPSQKPLENTL